MFSRLKKFVSRTPENGGRKELAMADSTTAPPAATNAGQSSPDVEKLIQERIEAAIEAALKPVTTAIAELDRNHKVLADTIAAQKPVTPDEVRKLIGDADEARRVKADQDAEAAKTKADADAKKTAARHAAIEKAGLAKLDPALLASLPDTDDATALDEAAGKIAASVDAIKAAALPNVGGAKQDGGTAAGAAAGAAASSGGFAGMSPAVAAYAKGMKLPA